jgi:hypothetical protein
VSELSICSMKTVNLNYKIYTKVGLIRLGIYFFVNKARGCGAPIFSFIVISQLYETKISQL